MKELVMQGMQQKLEKSCFKNTWHVQSNYTLQPPIIWLLLAIG